MLPNFLIIGAQKAGSSWFSEGLGTHPDIFVAPREGHFFNDHYERGLEWYERLFDGQRGEQRVSESTPGYIYDPAAPGRIRSDLGSEVRLIASLRHPVDRAYSAFWNAVTSGRLPGDLHFADFFRTRDDYGIRSRGFYHEQLARFVATFPRENLLVFVQEDDLRLRGVETLRSCYEFLGVDPAFEPARAARRVNANQDFRLGHASVTAAGRAMARFMAGAPRTIREPLRAAYLRAFSLLPKKRSYHRLPSDLRRELLEMYRPDIHRLEDLLGRDLSLWYDA